MYFRTTHPMIHKYSSHHPITTVVEIITAHYFLEFIASFICHKIQTKCVYLLIFFGKKFIEFVTLYDLS